MKVLPIAALALGLAALILVLALLLPETRSVRRSVVLEAPVARVFSLVADAAGQTGWRSDVAAVEMAPDGRSWRERLGDGETIDFRVVASDPGRRFEIAFQSPRGFSGTWRGDFADEGGRTRLDLLETVTVPSVFGRVVGRLLGMPDAHVDRYLADLEKALAAP